MTLARVTGLLLIAMPLAFNLFFFLLGRRFAYPSICASRPGRSCAVSRPEASR